MKGLDSINVTLLRSFRSVVAKRSITQAARELGYVPSAVSQHVTRLERAVGVQLITRAPGEPVAPTAAGRQVAQASADMLAAVADFVTACRAVGDGNVELRVAAYPTAAGELLPEAIELMRSADAGALVSMVEAEPTQGFAALAEGAVDLLIAYRYLPDDLPRTALVEERLLGAEYLPVVRRRGVCVEDLPWVAGRSGSPSRRLLEHWAAAAGATLDIRYEVEDPHAVLALCARGIGRGLVPATLLRARPDLDIVGERLSVAGRVVQRQVVALTRHRYEHPLTDVLCEAIGRGLAESTRRAIP